MFCSCLPLFHIGMLTAMLLREAALRMPPPVRATLARYKGRLAGRVQFLLSERAILAVNLPHNAGLTTRVIIVAETFHRYAGGSSLAIEM
jgi:hypothetical protein